MNTQTTLLGLIFAGILVILGKETMPSYYSKSSFAPPSMPAVVESKTVSYTYEAELVRVIDGDTVILDIDLGFDHWLKGQKMRLYGIDAPESRTRDLEEKELGQAATEWLQNRLTGNQLVVQSIQNKDKASQDSFGRWLAILFIDEVNINQELVDLGFAKSYSNTR